LGLAFDVRCLLADAQVADLEQLRPGPLPNRATVGELHVAILLRGSLEEGLGLLGGPGAVLPAQFREGFLAEQVLKLPGKRRLLLDEVESLQGWGTFTRQPPDGTIRPSRSRQQP